MLAMTAAIENSGSLVLVLYVTLQSIPPPLLQIHHEGILSGREADYAAIEDDTARLCADLGCPHPYLAAESLSVPTEVWFFNGYRDDAERARVDAAYKANAPLIARMRVNSERKAPITIKPTGVIATYESSRGDSWKPGHGRFLVITVTAANRPLVGSVFATPDRRRFAITATRTREEAEAVVAAASGDTRVFAVRPRWSFPDRSWIAADPDFWRQPRRR